MVDNKDSIHFPHDNSFKSAMSDLRAACDFFKHYLPQHLKSQINFDHLKIQNGSFVDKYLDANATDILYQTQLNQSEQITCVYLLVEHQSTPDLWMAFRLLK